MAEFIFSAFADEAGATLDEQISALRENDIRLIEPRNIDGKGILNLTEEELHAVKKKLDAAGIRVGSVGSPIGKYPIDDDFDTYLTKVERCLHVAEVLDTRYIRMFSFFVGQDELVRRRHEVMRRLSVMADMATAHGITMCHENESAIYGQMPSEVADILRTVPKLGGIFDAANYRMNGADPMDGIMATLPSLRYLHIKDAIFKEQEIVPAGEGEGRVGDVIDLVNEQMSGRVMLTLEPHLRLFDAYKDIDHHELKGKYHFNTNREAFDFAVRALEKLMTERGYRKDENAVWKK